MAKRKLPWVFEDSRQFLIYTTGKTIFSPYIIIHLHLPFPRQNWDIFGIRKKKSDLQISVSHFFVKNKRFTQPRSGYAHLWPLAAGPLQIKALASSMRGLFVYIISARASSALIIYTKSLWLKRQRL